MSTNESAVEALITEPLLSSAHQAVLHNVRDRVANYAKAMAPGLPISDADGGMQQKYLWTGVLMYLMGLPADEFLTGWKEFLNQVQQHRNGVFSPAYVNRFHGTVQLTTAERRNFQRLIHLATMTADPRSRALMLKQVDLNMIISGLPSEPVRQKFVAFYQN